MRRLFRRAVFTGLVAGGLYALFRSIQRRHAEGTTEWEASPFPFPPVPRPPAGPEPAEDGVHVPDVVAPGGGPELEETVVTEVPWIEPVDDTCPPSHPVKAKLRSGIFHVPGGGSYERTKPDRCYCDADAAQADGLRQSKV